MSRQGVMERAADQVPQVFQADEHAFRENFNRAPFSFSHHLAGHPLFELPRLLELAKALPPRDIYYDAGDIRVDQRWDQTPRPPESVDELVDRIENAGAWIVLRRIDQDPRYAALLRQGLAEVRDVVGPAYPKRIKHCSAGALVTSPRRVTAYHIDGDCNFLMQLRGKKVVSVFDRFDRDVITDVELERFWAGDRNAAVYKPQYEDRARRFEVRPGTGVHIPVNAPHWVQNDDNVSVSLSMSFVFPDSVLANVYHCNHLLRKIGLRPRPPGRSCVLDAMKGTGLAWAKGLHRCVKWARGLVSRGPR
jgi:hypothetical protein